MGIPAKRIWTYRLVPKATFLTDRLSHLQAEVGLCIPILFKAQTGFWSIARMLFPILEATAEGILPTINGKRKPVRLLRRLGIRYPNLVWEMYRHTLMHNDDMYAATYRGMRMKWSISLGGGHGARVRGLIHVDLEQLYNDLVAFLVAEIAEAKAHPSRLRAKASFEFNEGFAKATKAEARRLASFR